VTRRAQEHLHAFMRALAESGVAAGFAKHADFLRSLAQSPPDDLTGLYWRARVTLVTDPEAFPTFDAIFDAFFGTGRLVVREPGSEPASVEGETAAPHAGDEGELEPLEPRAGTGLHASPLDLRGTRRFPRASDATREQLRELEAALAEALPRVVARRLRRGRRGRRLDVGRVLRAANRSGGEIVALAWLRRPSRPRRVLLLIDVSGSQRQYTADLLRFAHAVRRADARAEAFTFGTRLTRISAVLATPDVDRALDGLSATLEDVDGGTRIGASLAALLANGRFVALARGALIIVLSDGLERGEVATMVAAVRRLGRLGNHVLWWSPLAREPRYQPVTRGMCAVLPDIDELAGAGDLESLLTLVRRLPQTTARPRGAAARMWGRDPQPIR
jgi:uncharacterized protein with von Willebrand factor type A (vWA) domain